MNEGNNTLVNSKYLWLTNPSKMTDQAKTRFKELQSSELATERAWALKEVLRELWNYTSAGWALKFWKRWYYWATHSRLQPMIDDGQLHSQFQAGVFSFKPPKNLML